MFTITNKDRNTNTEKKYTVRVRGAYLKTIKSEKELIRALKNTAQGYINMGQVGYGESVLKKIENGHILWVCDIFGVLDYSKPIETKRS
jgi:hypothetical protein